MNQDFQSWNEDYQRRIVERGLDKYQVFRMDMMQDEHHWVMEMQSDNPEKMLSLARELMAIRLPDSEGYRYRVRLFDKDNNRDIDLTIQ